MAPPGTPKNPSVPSFLNPGQIPKNCAAGILKGRIPAGKESTGIPFPSVCESGAIS
jgi:hypothetical protein